MLMDRWNDKHQACHGCWPILTTDKIGYRFYIHNSSSCLDAQYTNTNKNVCKCKKMLTCGFMLIII